MEDWLAGLQAKGKEMATGTFDNLKEQLEYEQAKAIIDKYELREKYEHMKEQLIITIKELPYSTQREIVKAILGTET